MPRYGDLFQQQRAVAAFHGALCREVDLEEADVSQHRRQRPREIPSQLSLVQIFVGEGKALGLEEGRRLQEGDEGWSGLLCQGGPGVDQEVRLRIALEVRGEHQLVGAHRHDTNLTAAVSCDAGGQVDHIVLDVERLLRRCLD